MTPQSRPPDDDSPDLDALVAGFEQLETPVPLVDVDIAGRNISRWQAQCDRLGIANRPHIKTHKLALLARQQIAAGAVGITCQKLGEAEAMADAGIHDILVSYNIVGEAKLKRLAALARRTRLSVVTDSLVVAKGLDRVMLEAGLRLDVLVECDTGGRRCGVGSPEAAVDLAAAISAMNGLQFAGWMNYPPPGGRLAAEDFFIRANLLAGEKGLAAIRISTGGTPDMWSVLGLGTVNEYRAGTYVYNDRSRLERGICRVEDCAITVLATIVSRPSPERAIIDAGTKSLTSDLIGLKGYGAVLGIPDATIPRLDEEHGYIQFATPRHDLPVGTRLRILPNHACVVSNLVDEVALVAGDKVVKFAAVTARGRVL